LWLLSYWNSLLDVLNEINKSKNHGGSMKNIIINEQWQNAMKSKSINFLDLWPSRPFAIRAVDEATMLDFLLLPKSRKDER